MARIGSFRELMNRTMRSSIVNLRSSILVLAASAEGERRDDEDRGAKIENRGSKIEDGRLHGSAYHCRTCCTGLTSSRPTKGVGLLNQEDSLRLP